MIRLRENYTKSLSLTRQGKSGAANFKQLWEDGVGSARGGLDKSTLDTSGDGEKRHRGFEVMWVSGRRLRGE